MATLPIYDRSGKQVGSYEVDPSVFATGVNRQLLHDAVVMYQANRRVGSQKTKTRGEVSGSTKKMYRQKGTGNARAGSKRSGIRRGGGHMKAIQPRDWSYRMPKKAVRLATRMAIRSRLEGDQVVIVSDLGLTEPKTREMAAVLRALNLEGQTTLVATAEHDPTVYRSARNISGVNVMPVSDLNALALLQPRRVLFTRAALDALVESTKATAKHAQPAGKE